MSVRQQAIADREQTRHARQKQLDNEQTGRDEVQDVLDQHRDDIDTGAGPSLGDVEGAVGRRQTRRLLPVTPRS